MIRKHKTAKGSFDEVTTKKIKPKRNMTTAQEKQVLNLLTRVPVKQVLNMICLYLDDAGYDMNPEDRMMYQYLAEDLQGFVDEQFDGETTLSDRM